MLGTLLPAFSQFFATAAAVPLNNIKSWFLGSKTSQQENRSKTKISPENWQHQKSDIRQVCSSHLKGFIGVTFRKITWIGIRGLRQMKKVWARLHNSAVKVP